MLKFGRLGSLAILMCAVPSSLVVTCSRSSAQEAEPSKPFLGVIVEQTDESSPVLVIDVHEKGPAAVAGVKRGDAIESINGIAIATTQDMATAMKGKGVGATLKFIVKRGSESITADVKLTAAPTGAPTGGVAVEEKAPPTTEDGAPVPLPPPDSAGPTAPSSPGPARPYLGLTVVPTARGGASISSIRKDSPAARAGFPLGGVIFKVNDLAVDNPDDLIDYIASLAPGANIELSYMHNERVYRKQVKLSSIGGTTIYSKPEAEDIEAPPPAPAPGGSDAKPSLLTPKDDRPILNGIGRALGGAMAPGIGAAPSAQKQIDDLRALVTTLEARIAKLETELATLRPAKPEETPAPPPATAP